MAANFSQNLKSALEGKPIRSIYGFTDSSVALYWVRGEGNYKQFLSSRAKEIQKKSYIQWWFIPAEKNLADVTSSGCNPQNIPIDWSFGPKWLQDQNSCSSGIVTEPNNETE